MPISVEARVWLATHLLYPNSTQAFDVYQAIVSQSEKAIQNKDFSHLLVKLLQICEKIPPVNSNLSFHVFENKPINEWRIIFKKTKKTQQLIFIGVLIFDLKLDQIAQNFKITTDKARFLFQQVFKKVVEQKSQTKIFYEFKFKKNNDQGVSYLFTNENLIEYSMGYLSASDVEKVKIGLQNYPDLQAVEKIYQLISKQMQDLIIDHASFAIQVPNFPVSSIANKNHRESRLNKLNRLKKPISISALSVVLLATVFMRPKWIENFSGRQKTDAIVLLELNKAPNSISDESEFKAAMNLNELPIQSPTKHKIIANKKIALSEPRKLEESPSISAEGKKQGGLYRSVLVVTDLDEVSAKIREKIIGLGARKAGEVELGWKKSASLAYYHFTIPTDSVDDVNEFLAKFGQYKVDYENHPRLVPAGQKRFIIEVKQSE